MSMFSCINEVPSEVHRFALVWLPENSLLRQSYVTEPNCLPVINKGLTRTWGATEQIIRIDAESVAFSPDGTRIAIALRDGTAQIWNGQTGEEETQFCASAVAYEHEEIGQVSTPAEKERPGMVPVIFFVISVAYFPNGSQILSEATTTSHDSHLVVWNARSGEQELRIKHGKFRARTPPALSRDGTRIAARASHGAINIWNAQTGEKEHTFASQIPGTGQVTFSHDGTRIISIEGAGDATILAWNAHSGMEELRIDLRTTMKSWRQTRHFYPVAISPDDTRIVFGCSDSVIRMYNSRNGKEELRFVGHTGRTECLAFCPDGMRVISASSDGTIRIWNTLRGEEELRLVGHSECLQGLAISPDGSRLVSASIDATIRVWRMRNREKSHHPRREHTTGAATSAAFSLDGTRLVTSSINAVATVWNAQNGEMEHQIVIGRGTWVHLAIDCMAFSHNGTVIAIALSDRIIGLWDLQTGKLKEHGLSESGPQWDYTEGMSQIAFSSDDKLLVAGTTRGNFCVWHVETWTQMLVHDYNQGPGAALIAFSQHGGQVLAGFCDGTFGSWDRGTGDELLVASTDSVVMEVTNGRLGAYLPLFRVPVCLSADSHWILDSKGQRVCWLPLECRGISSWSIFGTRLGFGCSSGSVFIIDCRVALQGAIWALSRRHQTPDQETLTPQILPPDFEPITQHPSPA